jgi:ribosomal protein L27
MILLEGTAHAETLDASAGLVGYEIRGLGGSDVIYGSAFADLIVGGPGGDQMFGNGGDDVFLIGEDDPSSDIVKGGDGFDTILGGAGSGVLRINGIVSIERIDGGGGFNVLRGTDKGTYWDFSQTELIAIAEIDGAGGNDIITGSAGDDRIVGGAGDDTLEGGAGIDTAVYSGNFAAYALIPLTGGKLRVTTTANSDGTDTIRGFEILEFADGTYSLADGVFTPFGDPTNNAPIAAADAYAGTEDQVLVVAAAAGVLANDSDPDGDAVAVSAFDATSAQGGAVVMNPDGSFSYTPAGNFNGSDSFSYSVTDGRGGTAVATVTLAVAAVNDAPLAANNSYIAKQDTALVVNPASGVLANDSDSDGDALTVAAFDTTSVQGGAVIMNADGSFTYTPPAGFTGSDSFSYTATDGTAQAQATALVQVAALGGLMSEFQSIIAELPEGEWAKLNLNEFHDVWTPKDQRPGLAGDPGRVILAWGAAAWDSNRDEYIFWGGGHANYAGNEVYTWSAETLLWERASLPSAVVQLGPSWYETADGYLNSPISSHAYDNLEFLEVADRMINFGGAAAHTGAGFVESDGTTKTGPYIWDPSKADPNKVGGLTGSHVNPDQYPDVVGGEMWENRATWSSATPVPGWMVQGTTDYAKIDGVDVVFVNPYNGGLYKYTLYDVNDPSLDTWEKVGNGWDTFSGEGAGAYDPDRNVYVRTSKTEFTYWNLDDPGLSNRNSSFVPADASGEFVLSVNWGIEYDPVRKHFVLWEGDAAIWYLKPPDEPAVDGWLLVKAPEPLLGGPAIPDKFTGVLGKWDYVEKYDVFVGVTDHITGDVWAYKPEGWTPGDWLV